MSLREKVIAESHRLMLEALRQREQEIIRFLVVLGPALAGFIWLLISFSTFRIDETTFTVGVIGVISVLLIGAAYCIALGYNYRYVLYLKMRLEREAKIDNIMPKAWAKSDKELIAKLYKKIGKHKHGPYCIPPEIIKVFWLAFIFIIIWIFVILFFIKQSCSSHLVESISDVAAVILGGWFIPRRYGNKLRKLYENKETG